MLFHRVIVKSNSRKAGSEQQEEYSDLWNVAETCKGDEQAHKQK